MGWIRRKLFNPWRWRWWWEFRERVDDRRLGRHLNKASYDHFEYAIGLKCGLVITTEEVTVRGRWVYTNSGSRMFRLRAWDGEVLTDDYGNSAGPAWRFDRGIQIRLSEIAWVADCPGGS